MQCPLCVALSNFAEGKVVCCTADLTQKTLDGFVQSSQAPPPFVRKEDAGQYNPSSPWLIDVFLQTTEKPRE